MKARSSVMLKMIIKSPMQLSHLIAGLAMVRQMQQPVRAMAFRRVDEEWGVEFGASAVLNMPIEPVLNQVTPALAMSHIHEGPDVLATQFNRQQRLGLGGLHRQKIDQGIDRERQQDFRIAQADQKTVDRR